MRASSLPASLAVLLALAFAGVAAAQEGASSATSDEQMLEEHADAREAPPEDAPDDDEVELPPLYSAIGLQKVSSGFDNVDDAINLDATAVGFRIPTLPWFGVEVNISATLIPGQIREVSGGGGGGTTCTPLEELLGCTPGAGSTTSANEGDFAMVSYGVYAAARSPGKFFASGKVGYRYVNTNLPEYADNRTGNAWGVGIGYRWRDDAGTWAELGYTKLTEDISGIGFSISYSYDRSW